MQCDEAQELISEYIDARLDDRLRTIFEAHLAACATCRDKTDLLNRTNRLFVSLPQVEPPVGFTTRLRAHVQEEATKPNLWKWLSLPFQIGVPIQATAVVLIAVLAGFLYQKERPLETSTQEVPIGQQKQTSEQGAPPQAPGTQEQQRQGEPLSKLSQEAQRQQQRSAPSSALRPFGSDSPVADAGNEYSRVGGEAAVDDRLVVRLRAPARDEISMPSLSQDQVKNLNKTRQRAAETGQTQSELFSIPRDRYEQFKKELAAIGNIESDRARTPQKSESSAQQPERLLIMVTIVPPAPAQPGGVR